MPASQVLRQALRTLASPCGAMCEQLSTTVVIRALSFTADLAGSAAPSMSTRFAIGIMARAPVPGETKTRLIPRIGADGAARLQRELTLRALQTATDAAPQAVTLFTAGETQHPFWDECAARFGMPLIEQGGAHLGVRMLHALHTLLQTCECAALIGTDCPALRPEHLIALRDGLDTACMAFIPAEDGGYVAVAARETVAAAFGALDWGTASVMAQTRDALSAAGWRQGRQWVELSALWDVDLPDDLLRAHREGLISTVP